MAVATVAVTALIGRRLYGPLGPGFGSSACRCPLALAFLTPGVDRRSKRLLGQSRRSVGDPGDTVPAGTRPARGRCFLRSRCGDKIPCRTLSNSRFGRRFPCRILARAPTSVVSRHSVLRCRFLCRFSLRPARCAEGHRKHYGDGSGARYGKSAYNRYVQSLSPADTQPQIRLGTRNLPCCGRRPGVEADSDDTVRTCLCCHHPGLCFVRSGFLLRVHALRRTTGPILVRSGDSRSRNPLGRSEEQSKLLGIVHWLGVANVG